MVGLTEKEVLYERVRFLEEMLRDVRNRLGKLERSQAVVEEAGFRAKHPRLVDGVASRWDSVTRHFEDN